MASTGSETDEMNDRVLHIRFRRGDDEQLLKVLDALDRGETPEPVLEVVYHDVQNLHRVTRPKNLELLRAIVREGPASIRETARLVERDVRQVHRNLKELEELGLLEFEENGRAKRSSAVYLVFCWRPHAMKRPVSAIHATDS